MGWMTMIATVAILSMNVGPQENAATVASSPQPGSSWQVFSRSADRAYLADVGTISVIDDVTSISVARVSRRKPPGDFSHSVELYNFRCATNTLRLGETVEYGADGSETHRFDDGADWEPIRPDSVDDFVKGMACDGMRAEGAPHVSIKAFVEAGRGN